MYVRNVLKAGDVVCTVPIGLKITLVYSKQGSLHRIYKGFESEDDISDKLLIPFCRRQIVPAKIQKTLKEVVVRGVLYTSKRFYGDGPVSSSIEDSMIEEFLKNQNGYKFFAGYVTTNAKHYTSATAMHQQLTSLGFKNLPFFFLADTPTKKKFEDTIQQGKFPFVYPLITDYIIFRQEDIINVDTQLSQYVVDSIESFFDSDGNFKAKVYTSSGVATEYHWSDIVNFNIQKSTLVISDAYGTIIYSNNSSISTKIKPQPDVVPCPSCGRLMHISKKGITKCEDVHCASRAYPVIKNFLSSLGLAPLSKVDLDELLRIDNSYKDPAKLFDSKMYSEYDVHTSVGRLLKGLILNMSEDSANFIWDGCKNEINTLEYYIHNTDKIQSDFRNQDISICEDILKFRRWCEDSKNVDTLLHFLHHDRVHLDLVEKAFNGDPIFRNVHIYITGKFLHGDLTTISRILRSYSATVQTVYDKSVSCVVVGSLKEDIDGLALKKAKKSGVKIFDENEFFKMYEIDKDLKKNL